MRDKNDFNQGYIEAKSRASQLMANRQKKPGKNDGLPPGQHLVAKMVPMPPIISRYPEIAKSKWRLRVDGEVGNEMIWDWQRFNQLPQKEFIVDFHCVTSWSKLGQKFSGVDFQEIVKAVRPTDLAKFIIFEGADGGYTTNVIYQELLANQAFVALKIDGADIPPKYGGPARMVIPHLYGWKSCKFLNCIRFQVNDQPGFWEVRGYHNHADPWQEERYG